MKVGIITFQRAYNYGAVLQAYALCETINHMGFSCEVIDYHNAKFDNIYKKISVLKSRNLREFLSAIVYGRIRNSKRKLFAEFVEKEIKVSKTEYSSENIKNSNPNYDVFITGSDQVWNLKLTNYDWNFFLVFVNSGKKKVSYAASIVAIDNDKEIEKEIIKALTELNHISLREKSGVNYVKSLGLPYPELVLDPTLLLTKEQWVELENRNPIFEKLPDRYLLAYFVSPTITNYDQMKSLGEEIDLPIVLINYTHQKVDGVINLLTVSPGQFVSLIDRACFVVTNSFHGTAFSINLRKDFLYILNTEIPQKNERILSLVEALDLTDRDFTKADLGNQINWDNVSKKLESLRKHSLGVLRNEIER